MLVIYFFQMVLNKCEMWSKGIKIAFFFKKLQKIAQRLGASSPEPRLWYVWINCIFICNFWFKPSPFTKLSVKCQTRPRLLIFHSTISLFHKNSSFKNFWWLHCMWFLVCPPTPIKNPGYAYARVMAFRAVSPQITAWAPQASVNFCSSTTSKLLPKNR